MFITLLKEEFNDNINIIRNKYIRVDNYLKFYIKDTCLFINSISSTEKLTGAEILKKLEKVILMYGNIKSIKLFDDSIIILDNDFTFRLSILCLLSDGQSWYNKLGYYQENFNKDKYINIINLNFYTTLISFKKYKYSFDELFDLKRLTEIINKEKINDNNIVINFCINFIISKITDRTLLCKDVGLYFKINKHSKEDIHIYLQIMILLLFEHLFDYPREIELIKYV